MAKKPKNRHVAGRKQRRRVVKVLQKHCGKYSLAHHIAKLDTIQLVHRLADLTEMRLRDGIGYREEDDSFLPGHPDHIDGPHCAVVGSKEEARKIFMGGGGVGMDYNEINPTET